MLRKNKTTNKNSFILNVNQNTSSNSSSKIRIRKKLSISKKKKIIKSLKHLNSKTDALNKNENVFLNIKNINYNKFIKSESTKKNKQSIGINTSSHIDQLQPIYKKDIKEKKEYKDIYDSEIEKSKKMEILNSSSILYNKLFVGYNDKGEFMDNVKIKKLRRNINSFSSYQNNIYRNKSNKKIFNFNSYNKKKALCLLIILIKMHIVMIKDY